MGQTRQIALGPVLAAVAALVLLVSLFLDWYEPGFSAWTVFEFLDLLLAVLALASIGIAAQGLGLGLSGARVPRGALLPVAVVALVIVSSQLIQHPPVAVGRGVEIGAWLALGAVVVLVAGAALGTSYVSVVRVGGPGESGPAAPRSAGTAEPTHAPSPEPPLAGDDPPTQPISRSEPERPA